MDLIDFDDFAGILFTSCLLCSSSLQFIKNQLAACLPDHQRVLVDDNSLFLYEQNQRTAAFFKKASIHSPFIFLLLLLLRLLLLLFLLLVVVVGAFAFGGFIFEGLNERMMAGILWFI